MNRGRTKRAEGGFTLVEVLIAMAVLVMGAMALYAMVGTATEGNMRARRITIATELTRSWVDRVRMQALQWGPSANGTIPWLDQLPDTGTGSSGWFRPDPTVVTPAANWQGLPIPPPDEAALAAPAYCTHLRLTWLTTQGDQAVRLDVRTWWHRYNRETEGVTAEARDLDNTNDILLECGEDADAVQDLTDQLANDGGLVDFSAVHTSTVIRWAGSNT